MPPSRRKKSRPEATKDGVVEPIYVGAAKDDVDFHQNCEEKGPGFLFQPAVTADECQNKNRIDHVNDAKHRLHRIVYLNYRLGGSRFYASEAYMAKGHKRDEVTVNSVVINELNEGFARGGGEEGMGGLVKGGR